MKWKVYKNHNLDNQISTTFARSNLYEENIDILNVYHFVFRWTQDRQHCKVIYRSRYQFAMDAVFLLMDGFPTWHSSLNNVVYISFLRTQLPQMPVSSWPPQISMWVECASFHWAVVPTLLLSAYVSVWYSWIRICLDIKYCDIKYFFASFPAYI